MVKLPDIIALKKKYKVSPAMLVLSLFSWFWMWAEQERLEARLCFALV